MRRPGNQNHGRRQNPAGRPIDRAEVILRWKANAKHPRASLGKNIRTQFESRTDQEGEVSFPGVPQGNIQIQVNAQGYQTFGQIFDIDERGKNHRGQAQSAATAVHVPLGLPPRDVVRL